MPGKVLIVDDDPVVCELIQKVLSSVEMEGHAVTDSARAGARLREEKFDAVFLDACMPPPDGIDLTRQMRTSGFNQFTPIVMLAGEEDRTILTRAFQVGANFFLFKPVSRESLLRLVRAIQSPIQREKRRFTRVKLSSKVSMESNHQKLDGSTIDVSLNGLLVQAAKVFPQSARVDLRLELPAGAAPVRAKGRVVRVIGNDRMGISLQDISAADSERLQEFLLPLLGTQMGI